MKFKFGFTLAEVLITLGIIGVISALTLPTFTANVTDAQIGPKLGKAVEVFENGAVAYLNEHGYSRLSEIPTENSASRSYSIMNALRANIKYTNNFGSKDDAVVGFSSKDGARYIFWFEEVRSPNAGGDFANSRLPQDEYIGAMAIVFGNPEDDDDYTNKNTFNFFVYNDGTLAPVGSRDYNKTVADNGESYYWNDAHNCPNRPNAVQEATSCTGSFFEQGMKINYELVRGRNSVIIPAISNSMGPQWANPGGRRH